MAEVINVKKNAQMWFVGAFIFGVTLTTALYCIDEYKSNSTRSQDHNEMLIELRTAQFLQVPKPHKEERQ